MNADQPVNRLPVELLQTIFRHIKTTFGRQTFPLSLFNAGPDDSCMRNPYAWLTITHVCHLWRRSCIEYTDLWRTIYLHERPRDTFSLAFMCFERSKGLPLELEHDCFVANDYQKQRLSDFYCAIMQDPGRLKGLYLGECDFYGFSSDLFELPLPNIVDLNLCFRHYAAETTPWPDQVIQEKVERLLDGCSRTVRRLSLVDFTYPGMRFPHLTHLCLAQDYGANSFSLSDLLVILEATSRTLQFLYNREHLYLDGLNSEEPFDIHHPDRRITMSSLTHLEVEIAISAREEDEDASLILMHHLFIPLPVKIIWDSFSSLRQANNDWELLPPHDIISPVDIIIGFNKRPEMIMIDGNRLYVDVGCPSILDLIGRSMPQVKTLALPVHVGGRDNQMDLLRVFQAIQVLAICLPDMDSIVDLMECLENGDAELDEPQDESEESSSILCPELKHLLILTEDVDTAAVESIETSSLKTKLEDHLLISFLLSTDFSIARNRVQMETPYTLQVKHVRYQDLDETVIEGFLQGLSG